MYKIISLIIAVLFAGINIQAQNTGSFTDNRDQNTYKTIAIGNQIWMAENLAFQVQDSSWGFNDGEQHVSEFGYFYKWQVAQNVCPNGWKLPSKEDFEILLNNYDKQSEKACIALTIDGESGFIAKLIGWRGSYGGFTGKEENAMFWTSSNHRNHYRWALGIFNDEKKAVVFDDYDSRGFTVRCLKE